MYDVFTVTNILCLKFITIYHIVLSGHHDSLVIIQYRVIGCTVDAQQLELN